MISSMYAVKSLPLAPPSWPILLGARDQHLDLNRKLVSVPARPARSISQRFRAAVVVAAENLVAGLAGDAELAAISLRACSSAYHPKDCHSFRGRHDPQRWAPNSHT